MIPNKLPYYIFIRVSIWSLRAVAPISITYCMIWSLGYRFLPWQLEVLAVIEASFYLFASRPRQWMLNKSGPRVVQRSQQERRDLFEKCWNSIPDLESFLSVWFHGASADQIHREDLKDFLAWGFLYKDNATIEDDVELEEYVRYTEETLQRTFLPGRSSVQPLRVSTDPLRLQHKPFVFYSFAVGTDDLMTYLTARYIGLQHYRLPLSQFFTVFPFRPHTLASKHVSPSDRLSYWYRPHTSTKRLPVLLIHGIGAGMRTYTGFLRDLMEQENTDDTQIGIIALELMPISMRITRGILPRTEMLREIMKILDHHGWEIFTILGHSYGTILATHLLQHLGSVGRIGPMILVDPVTLSIHWGGVPFNFLYRAPRKASEWQLHYFASTDMCVAHTITRRFDWTENVLWKDQIKGRTMTIALASEDIILDSYGVSKYLSDDPELNARLYKSDSSGRTHELVNEGEQSIVWFHGINHAEMFDSASSWKTLVGLVHRYCDMSQ